MRCVIALSCIIIALTSIGQDSTRGLSIIPAQKQVTGTTRALIVGISSYQNLPSLEYADKDAEEFASFLSSNKGWQVDSSNIKLLSNEKAKAGDIISWLMWLLETSKSGDNIVFYFSGHGDVETNKDVNKGYLLAHDAPKNNYVAGGAIAIDLLRDIYTEMIDKGIRLYMVTDACRAGHLAGGSAGAKITAESFSKQWRNEIKILSAQPDELSYEGRQWGGGRGVFSFFLTKGLSGYADLNKDSSITLAEIEQYVGLQVSQETGFKQQPVFEGASKYSNKIASIDENAMSRYSQYKGNNITVAVITEKGQSNIEAGDCRSVYEQFRHSLDILNDSATISNATKAYSLLLSCNNESLQSTARFNLTATLMNHVQQIVNQTLIGQKLIGNEKLSEGLTVIDLIYKINEGKRLVNTAHLQNIKRYFIINKTSFWNEEEITSEVQEKMVRMLDSALVLEPGAAYLELTRGILLMNTEKYDSANIYFRKAIDHSPTWLMAYYYAGLSLGYNEKIAEAVSYMEKALALDSTYKSFECAKCFYDILGNMYVVLKQNKKAEAYLLKAAEDSFFIEPVISLISLYHEQKKIKQRDVLLNKVRVESKTTTDKLHLFELELDFGLINKKAGQNYLDSLEEFTTDEDFAFLYYLKGRWAKKLNLVSTDYFQTAHAADSNEFSYTDAYLESLCTEGKFAEAEAVISSISSTFKKSEQLKIKYYLALCYAYTNREKESLEIYKELVNQGHIECKELKKVKPLKKLDEYKTFMKSCR